MGEEIAFGVIDYCAFVGMLSISLGIGSYICCKGSKSPEEFLMGNRSLKPIPVSMSLLTSYVSAIAILGFSGETYANGMQASTSSIGVSLGIMFSSYFVLSMIFPLKLTSINEYIDLRFKSKLLTSTIFFLMMVNTLVSGGIVLYAPTLALLTITKLSTISSIFILGIVSTLYSSFGGVKAVIWTDVFQFSVMLIGIVAVMVVGCVQNGGFIETLHTASEGGRLELFDMNPSPFVRHTLLNTITAGFFWALRTYSSDQIVIQRICAVKSIKNAKSILMFTLFGMIAMNILPFSCGLVAYATYFGCDPMALGKIKKKDEILTYFVMDKLSFISGLSGLFVAAIIGGSLSTLSSIINSCVALLWKDVCLKFNYFKNTSQLKATFINKMLSLVVGAVLTGLAVIASNTRGLMEISFTFTNVLNGPILGVFLIGFFLPRCNLKGVWTGKIGSTVFILWLVIGGMIYKERTQMLPFSADGCVALNFSSVNISVVHETVSSTYSSNIKNGSAADTSFFVSLYQISYTLYGGIGVILCLILAVVVSYITGNKKIDEVSPKYVSSHVHKFFWTKKELDTIRKREEEINLDPGSLQDKENQPENGTTKITDNCLESN